MGYRAFLFFFLFFLFGSSSSGFTSIHISTLSPPYFVTLTIYQKGDLSLVQECYWIDLKEGSNTIQFDWSGTMIDVTSIRLTLLQHPDKVKVEEVIFSPGENKILLWKVKSPESLRELIEISYFTRGLSWKASYTLEVNEKKDRISQLQGWVKVKNKSGRDFLRSRIRLITGEPHLLKKKEEKLLLKAAARMEAAEVETPPQIRKEAISEYYLYQIQRESDLKTDKESQLSLFITRDLPLGLIYQFNFTRWGMFPTTIYQFRNNQHFPLPPGSIRGWLVVDGVREGYLGEGRVSFTPPDEEIEVNLGWEKRLKLERKITTFLRNGLKFSPRNDLVEYLEEEEYTLSIKNFLNKVAKIRLKEEIPGEWTLINSSIPVDKKEANALEFKLTIAEKGKEKFTYRVQKIIRLR